MFASNIKHLLNQNFIGKSSKHHRNTLGFSLIEVIVVTALTILILFSTVIMFLTFLINQARLTQRQKVKTAGDNALKQIEQAVRGAQEITTCEENMSTLEWISLAETPGVIEVVDDSGNNRIASQSGTETYLLTPENIIADPAEIRFDCYSTTRESNFVTVRFSLSTKDDEGLMNEQLRQNFQTSIDIRN